MVFKPKDCQNLFSFERRRSDRFNADHTLAEADRNSGTESLADRRSHSESNAEANSEISKSAAFEGARLKALFVFADFKSAQRFPFERCN